MSVDLTGSLYAAYRGAVRRGQQLRRVGEDRRAAAAFRSAARLGARYGASGAGTAERERRLRQSRRLEWLADELERGPSSTCSPPGERRQPEKEDELTARIEELITRTELTWDDVGGLDEAKSQLRTAFALAVARKPRGVRIDTAPNILLYGPPGTGKSLLAVAASNCLDTTFFSVKPGGVLSKWFGESPRLVTRLYQLARRRAPSVVFIDELESLFPSRDRAQSGAECRLLSALLSEISGVRAGGSESPVFTLGATNAPWLMDEAALSRFGRRIYVGLPDEGARRAILQIHLHRNGHRLDFPLGRLVRGTAGFSGRQIADLCTRAVESMVAARNPDIEQAASGCRRAVPYRIRTRPLQWHDFEKALDRMQPDTSSGTLRRFENWQRPR